MPGEDYRHWEYFPPNKEPKDSGVLVLSLEEATESQKTTIYRVRMLCCGSERDYSHREIVKRQRRISNRKHYCFNCRSNPDEVVEKETKQKKMRQITIEEFRERYNAGMYG